MRNGLFLVDSVREHIIGKRDVDSRAANTCNDGVMVWLGLNDGTTKKRAATASKRIRLSSLRVFLLSTDDNCLI